MQNRRSAFPAAALELNPTAAWAGGVPGCLGGSFCGIDIFDIFDTFFRLWGARYTARWPDRTRHFLHFRHFSRELRLFLRQPEIRHFRHSGGLRRPRGVESVCLRPPGPGRRRMTERQSGSSWFDRIPVPLHFPGRSVARGINNSRGKSVRNYCDLSGIGLFNRR